VATEKVFLLLQNSFSHVQQLIISKLHFSFSHACVQKKKLEHKLRVIG